MAAGELLEEFRLLPPKRGYTVKQEIRDGQLTASAENPFLWVKGVNSEVGCLRLSERHTEAQRLT